jgi:hypothetical protein
MLTSGSTPLGGNPGATPFHVSDYGAVLFHVSGPTQDALRIPARECVPSPCHYEKRSPAGCQHGRALDCGCVAAALTSVQPCAAIASRAPSDGSPPGSWATRPLRFVTRSFGRLVSALPGRRPHSAWSRPSDSIDVVRKRDGVPTIPPPSPDITVVQASQVAVAEAE